MGMDNEKNGETIMTTAKKKRRTLDDFATTEETASEVVSEQPMPEKTVVKPKEKLSQ